MLATLLPGLLDHIVEELPRRLLQAVKHDSVFSCDDKERRPRFDRERLANRTRNDDLSAEEMRVVKGILIVPQYNLLTLARSKQSKIFVSVLLVRKSQDMPSLVPPSGRVRSPWARQEPKHRFLAGRLEELK